jgi:hypothetical protein
VSLPSAERDPELNCRMIPVEYLHRNQSRNTLLSLIIIERQVSFITNCVFSDDMACIFNELRPAVHSYIRSTGLRSYAKDHSRVIPYVQ